MKKLLFCLFSMLWCMLIFVGCKNGVTTSHMEALPEPVLTKDMTTGVGILSDYESDDKIIFHGYFGVFVYDLKAQEMTLAIDLEKTVGTN